MHRNPALRTAALVALVSVLVGCEAPAPMDTVDHIDLESFMGDWYVLASAPTVFEKEAFNAVETYTLDDDGSVDTVFTFNKGAPDGPVKSFRSRGFVRDTGTNAEWGVQFIWPFRAEYLIVYVDEAYETTIVARTKRDYAWVMSRSPQIPEAEYDALIARLVDLGYDPAAIRRVPQLVPVPAGT